MRILFSLLLVVSLFSSCNRDATDASANQGTFLAPASAPTNADPRNSVPDDQKPAVGQPMIEGPSEADLAAANESNGGKMNPEEIAAAKRMGPGRQSPVVSNPQPSAPQEANQNKTPTMPVPASGSKPVIDYDRPVFTLYKPPCYGKCETYTLTLTADRQLLLHAKQNMKKEGKYAIRLTAREYNDLLTELTSLDLPTLQEVYPENAKSIPADAQMTLLTFPDEAGEEKRMEVYFDAPEKLASFLTRFEAMVERKDWVKMAGN